MGFCRNGILRPRNTRRKRTAAAVTTTMKHCKNNILRFRRRNRKKYQRVCYVFCLLFQRTNFIFFNNVIYSLPPVRGKTFLSLGLAKQFGHQRGGQQGALHGHAEHGRTAVALVGLAQLARIRHDLGFRMLFLVDGRAAAGRVRVCASAFHPGHSLVVCGRKKRSTT